MPSSCREEDTHVVDIGFDEHDSFDWSSEKSEANSFRWFCCICYFWSQFTARVHALIQDAVVNLAVHAARNPRKYVSCILCVSLTIFLTGIFTNFNINISQTVIFAPLNSDAKRNSDWIDQQSGFPEPNRMFSVSVHADGENVLQVQSIRRLFQVVDEVTSTEGYPDLCAAGDVPSTAYWRNGDGAACDITGVTQYFQHDVQQFDAIYEAGGDDAIIRQVSSIDNGNNTNGFTAMKEVETAVILGNAVRDSETHLISSAQSFTIFFPLVKTDGIFELEARIIERMASLRAEWDQHNVNISNDNNSSTPLLKLEYVTIRSYSDEFLRAIAKDLPLLPGGFLLMTCFTSLVFFKWNDRVRSRCLLGVGAVFNILLSLMSSFGLMFIFGVPYTSLTQVLPFVIFAVGLDDTFIITGAYAMTDERKEPTERIRETMQEVGLSITITTLTTMLAFLTGCFSDIPAILWLNLYATPAIVIDFFYQITFFVALLVLDENRIRDNRLDCCTCIQAPAKAGGNDKPGLKLLRIKSISERAMSCYTKYLLHPLVKVLVLVVFLAYFAFCVYSTTLLTQHFDVAELLPADSYAKDFLYSIETYTSRVLGVKIYFRGDINQLDPETQKQMNDYIDELSALPQFADEPLLCWFRDLEDFKETKLAQSIGMTDNMTLQEQLDVAFSVPMIQETYGDHIVFDDNGRITSSSCYTYISGVNLKIAEEQIQVLQDQRAVTAGQPINQGVDDWPFFTFNTDYFIWEFYSVVVNELVFNTIFGIAAVCVVCFFFFRHWEALLYIFPLMIMLYTDLLGTLQYVGLHINAVTGICLIISIGLHVDFIVHVLWRYYESAEKTRNGKVVETLETVGASILGGGLSTAMSVLPLAFSTSEILRTVFTCFFVMIAVAVTHGLMFFPVVLSICGPSPSRTANLGNFMGASKHADANERSDTDDSSDDDMDSTQSQKRQLSYDLSLIIKASDVESSDVEPSDVEPSPTSLYPKEQSRRDLVVKPSASDGEPSTPTVGVNACVKQHHDAMDQYKVIRTSSMSQNESLEVIIAF